MRHFINIVEAAQGQSDEGVIIAADIHEKVAIIHDFVVPKSLRGRGVGRREYEKWEANLPHTVELVKLFAADYGDGKGNSDGFWENMGFDYQYADADDYETAHMMWKGVNGHETPPPIEWDDED